MATWPSWPQACITPSTLGGDHAALAPLDDGQRVHVGAQHQRRPRLAAVEVGDHAGAADTGAHREAEVGAALRDQLGGIAFLE